MDDSPHGEEPSISTSNAGDSRGGSRQMLEVISPFIHLFEEYPNVRQYFPNFDGTSTEEIQSNVKLCQELRDHALRVFLLVGIVIGRMDPTLQMVW